MAELAATAPPALPLLRRFSPKMTSQLHPTCSRSRNTRLHVLHKLRQPPFLIHRRNDAASNRFPALCILFARKPRCLFSRQMTRHLRLGYLRSLPLREHISLLLCTNLHPRLSVHILPICLLATASTLSFRRPNYFYAFSLSFHFRLLLKIQDHIYENQIYFYFYIYYLQHHIYLSLLLLVEIHYYQYIYLLI